jgi:hypothetical protein
MPAAHVSLGNGNVRACKKQQPEARRHHHYSHFCPPSEKVVCKSNAAGKKVFLCGNSEPHRSIKRGEAKLDFLGP